MKINLPAVIVEERVADELNVEEIGEEFEERIAGGGDENFVAGIAEEAKDEGVGLAGAGGEENIFDREIG